MNIKRLLMLALLTLPMALMAQMKIATVDVQAIFAAMPESQRANEQLEKASQQYKAEYEMMQQEFNDKYAAYQGLAGDTPATIRDRRVREIQESNSSIESFLTKSQAALAAIKQELETPIYAKINAAIKEHSLPDDIVVSKNCDNLLSSKGIVSAQLDSPLPDDTDGLHRLALSKEVTVFL